MIVDPFYRYVVARAIGGPYLKLFVAVVLGFCEAVKKP